MIKRYSWQLTEGKITRLFSHAKYGKNKTCKRCKSRVLHRLNDQRHECSKCHLRFLLKTNTYLKHSRVPLDVWYELLWWFVYGFTANKTAKETELSQKLVHRCFTIIRKAVYGYEESNIKPVFGFYQRNGTVYVEFVSDAEKKTLQDIIKGKIVLKSNIYSDTWKSYRGLNKKGYHHETIDHGKGEYVKEKKGNKVHINGIEGFWGYLKEQLLKHHGVSKNNLIYYVKEQEFRFNNRHLSTDDMVNKIIKILMNSTPPVV